MFYVHCNGTGKQTSLKTRNEAEARNLLASYNESANTAQANRVIGMAYISQSLVASASRTWQLVFSRSQTRGGHRLRNGGLAPSSTLGLI